MDADLISLVFATLAFVGGHFLVARKSGENPACRDLLRGRAHFQDEPVTGLLKNRYSDAFRSASRRVM
jgi:hypothetical protein